MERRPYSDQTVRNSANRRSESVPSNANHTAAQRSSYGTSAPRRPSGTSNARRPYGTTAAHPYGTSDARRPYGTSDAQRSRDASASHGAYGTSDGQRSRDTSASHGAYGTSDAQRSRDTSASRHPYGTSEAQRSHDTSASRRAYDTSDMRRPASDSSASRRAPVNAAPRRRPPKRPESTRPNFILFACLAAVLVALFVVGSAWIITTVNRDTYCHGIYVNNTDLHAFTREEGFSYIHDRIDERMNTTYTLSGGGFSYDFTPSDYCISNDADSVLDRAWNIGHVGSIFDCSKAIRQLRNQPVYLSINPKYDEAKLDAFADRIYNDIYIAPTDAEVVVDINAPVLTGQSAPGREVDRETLRAQIDAILNGSEFSPELPIIELKPSISSDQAAATLDLIVEFSTDVSFRNYNSRYNVRKALSCFNGFCVHPGETVDFNEIVGERNQSNGWMEATEYAANNTTKGYGGGVCQASSTLYNGVIRALGWESILRRDAHSMTVSYLDPSLDAAVTNTNRDFVFKNVTDNPIYIYTEVNKNNATIRIFGVRPPYRYDLVSVILHKDRKAARKGYIEDTEGTHCFYRTDKPVLYKAGIPACDSQSWMIAYDWNTGAEVWRKQLENDHYESGTDIYWVGIHDENGAIITKEEGLS